MGINLPQLGIDTQMSIDFTKSEISKVSDRVNDINIAQKTVNTRGIKELLINPLEIPSNVATTNGNAVGTNILKEVPLSGNISDYNYITLKLIMSTTTRNFNATTNLISTKDIVYNNSNIYSNTDGSAIIIIFNLSGYDIGAYGASHFPIVGWFKTPSIFYLYNTLNPTTYQDYNKLKLTSIEGINIENVTIDSVSYVNTTQGIEDAPVGSIIDIIGESVPNHYIAYDNTEYKIADYPDLAQYIKEQFGSFNFFGGDGTTTFCVTDKAPAPQVLTDITPVMTSNTTPVPYIVSASSNSSDRLPWMAFNNVSAGSSLDNVVWSTSSTTSFGWIKLDFGKNQKVSHFSMSSHSTVSADGLPKEFVIAGSNNNSTFTEIKRFKESTMWNKNEKRTFSLDGTYNYRYYRLEILDNFGLRYSWIAELRYLLNDSFERKCIKYEPTYYMQVEGLMEESTLWEGSKVLLCDKDMTQFTNENITLSDNVNNYDMIRLVYTWFRTSDSLSLIPSHVDWLPIEDNPFFGIIFNYTFMIRSEMVDNKITFHSSISKDRGNTTGNAIKVAKVIGLKYKTFSKGGTP